jgi:hypothetical protein
MSLARLLDQTGRRDEARAMLAEIYGWFTEGSINLALCRRAISIAVRKHCSAL